jgi:RimJ/RimL family protein N-acetyltransferase
VHTVINNTTEDVIYICIGESQEFADEKILYPLNELRKKECIRKGWYWQQPPVWVTGPASSKSSFEQIDHISLKVCTEFDWQEVLNIFSESPRYFLNVEGCQPSEMTARHSIIDVPAHRSETYFKEFLIIEFNGTSIGTVDLHVHHPEQKICYLGLLLIKESLFGKGVGSKCYNLVEDYILRSLECEKVRLGISEDHDVENFWSKLGFKPNNRIYNWQGEQKVTSVQEFEKEIKK